MTDAAAVRIQQQFVQVGERRVFVRHAGQGPAVVLLHQSPQNSRHMTGWIEHLSPHHAVFAPDTPGFGQSDPLSLAQPTIPDLAAALLLLLDALALQRVLLLGVHTGAVIAARLALDAPQRVAAVVCDGLALFDASERRDLLDGYLPPFEPQWDGGHLLWLFARLREQHLFFPWHRSHTAQRLDYPLPEPAKVHADALDVLDAGDGYRAGYRAPFLYELGGTTAAALTVPAALLYREGDVLQTHIARFPPLPPNVYPERVVGGAAALLARASAVFAQHAGRASVVEAATHVGTAMSASRRLLPVAGTGSSGPSWLALRIAEGDRSRAELHLPDIGSAAVWPAARAPGACAVSVDLPGHGASTGWPADTLTLAAVTEALLQVLQTTGLGGTPVAVHARGASCAFAVALALNLGQRCASLTLYDPLPLDPTERTCFLAGLPDLCPDANGMALIAAWNWVRLKHLFWPWQNPHLPGAAIATGAPPPQQVHADVVEILRAGACHARLWQLALDFDLPLALGAWSGPLTLKLRQHPEMLRLAARLPHSAGPR